MSRCVAFPLEKLKRSVKDPSLGLNKASKHEKDEEERKKKKKKKRKHREGEEGEEGEKDREKRKEDKAERRKRKEEKRRRREERKQRERLLAEGTSTQSLHNGEAGTPVLSTSAEPATNPPDSATKSHHSEASSTRRAVSEAHAGSSGTPPAGLVLDRGGPGGLLGHARGVSATKASSLGAVGSGGSAAPRKDGYSSDKGPGPRLQAGQGSRLKGENGRLIQQPQRSVELAKAPTPGQQGLSSGSQAKEGRRRDGDGPSARPAIPQKSGSGGSAATDPLRRKQHGDAYKGPSPSDELQRRSRSGSGHHTATTGSESLSGLSGSRGSQQRHTQTASEGEVMSPRREAPRDEGPDLLEHMAERDAELLKALESRLERMLQGCREPVHMALEDSDAHCMDWLGQGKPCDEQARKEQGGGVAAATVPPRAGATHLTSWSDSKYIPEFDVHLLPFVPPW